MSILRKKIDKRISPKHFHVTIFGSSRVKRSDPAYKHVYELAKKIGERDIDVITGGGPGIMEAANRGHQKGAKGTTSHSIGLGIKLPREQGFNKSVQLYREFKTFSRRLDNFMLMSNAIVIAPGGVGTMLELLYSWQLMQVGHTCNIPVILLGDMWKGFISWLKKEPLKHKYFEKKDLDLLYFAKNSDEAIEIIEKAYETWAKGGKNLCLNYKKYQIKT